MRASRHTDTQLRLTANDKSFLLDSVQKMLRTEKAKKVFTSLRANTYTLHSFLKWNVMERFFVSETIFL